MQLFDDYLLLMKLNLMMLSLTCDHILGCS